MPQGPIQAAVAVRSSYFTPMQLDSTGNLNIENGGASIALNVTQATTIKGSPGRLRKVLVINGGTTSGGFVINDAATTTDATTTGSTQSNVVWFVTFTNATTLATNAAYLTFDFPMQNGITVSAVPGGGAPQLVVTYD